MGTVRVCAVSCVPVVYVCICVFVCESDAEACVVRLSSAPRSDEERDERGDLVRVDHGPQDGQIHPH